MKLIHLGVMAPGGAVHVAESTGLRCPSHRPMCRPKRGGRLADTWERQVTCRWCLGLLGGTQWVPTRWDWERRPDIDPGPWIVSVPGGPFGALVEGRAVVQARPFLFQDSLQAEMAAVVLTREAKLLMFVAPAGWQSGRFWCPCGIRFNGHKLGPAEAMRRAEKHGKECPHYTVARQATREVICSVP